MKVVFDTNIYISAFVIPGGKAEEAYLHALRGTFTLYPSVAILTETAQKLRRKFGWPENKVIRLLKAIARVATVLKTSQKYLKFPSRALPLLWGRVRVNPEFIPLPFIPSREGRGYF